MSALRQAHSETPSSTVACGTDSAAASMNSASWIVFRPLTYREIRRRIWHMAPGGLPFILQLVPHKDPISGLLRSIIIGICVVLGLYVLRGFQKISRQDEGKGIAAVAGYVFPVLLTILLFPGQLELGFSVLAILAFGDGSATLFGLAFRSPRLPWNRCKSWMGFLGFIVAGSIMTTWIYWGESHNPENTAPPVSLLMAAALTVPAVVVAAIVESMRMKLNDNIRVGIVASAVLLLLNLFAPF